MKRFMNLARVRSDSRERERVARLRERAAKDAVEAEKLRVEREKAQEEKLKYVLILFNSRWREFIASLGSYRRSMLNMRRARRRCSQPVSATWRASGSAPRVPVKPMRAKKRARITRRL